jgi:iron complex transport system substrate-binding protein/vitamin B12 transport system substrate-binding protein
MVLSAVLIASGAPAQSNPHTEPSSSGYDPARPAMRAITLAPHITELIYAAGAGGRIVGTVLSSDYPAEARGIPRIGDGLNIDTERAVSLRPDLVIAWQPSGAARTLAPVLDRLDIPLVFSAPRRLDDIPAEVLRMGAYFHTQDAAAATAEAMKRRLTALRARYSGKPLVRVFIQVGSDPLYTLGNDPLLNDVLATCQGINIFADAGVAAPQVSEETVLQTQPDVVIVPSTQSGVPARGAARWTTLQLPAAMAGHIHSMDPDALFRPGPRLIDAAEALCRLLDESR